MKILNSARPVTVLCRTPETHTSLIKSPVNFSPEHPFMCLNAIQNLVGGLKTVFQVDGFP